MRIKALKQERADLTTELKALSDKLAADNNRALTDEERTRRGVVAKRLDELDEEITFEANLIERQGRQGAIVDPNAEAAAAARQAAERQAAQPNAPAADGFASLGEQMAAVIRAGTPGGMTDPRLMRAGPTGLNEGVGSDGGFLVAQQRVTGIRERMYETGELLNRVNKQPIGDGFNGVKLYAIDETSRADGSRFGGVRVYWTAEGGEKLPSRPKFREMDLKLKKVAGLVYMTDELLQDSVALEAYINRILPEELKFAVEGSIIYGTGAGMPLGFMNAGGAVTVSRSAGPGTFTYADALAMWSRMWAPSRKNAVWLIDQSVETQMYSMSITVGTGGIPVFMPAGGVAQAPFATLFGRPIIPFEHGAAVGTLGDVMLVDPSAYTLIDKGGVQSASSMHVRFIYDETVLRFVYRVDGQPEWNAPLTPRSGGDTLGSFVLLGTGV